MKPLNLDKLTPAQKKVLHVVTNAGEAGAAFTHAGQWRIAEEFVDRGVFSNKMDASRVSFLSNGGKRVEYRTIFTLTEVGLDLVKNNPE